MAVMLHAWATVLPHRQPAGVHTRFEINYKLFEKLGLDAEAVLGEGADRDQP